MRIVDITREMMEAPVYPGDPAPRLEPLCRMEFGDVCNTSALYACLHNGTHLDAPRHFVPDGTDAAGVPLEACIGECRVAAWEGVLLGDYKCLPAHLEISADPTRVFVTLHEGKFHQIKRMFLSRGKTVLSLRRIAMGTLQLDTRLSEGEYRYLSEQEIAELNRITQK